MPPRLTINILRWYTEVDEMPDRYLVELIKSVFHDQFIEMWLNWKELKMQEN